MENVANWATFQKKLEKLVEDSNSSSRSGKGADKRPKKKSKAKVVFELGPKASRRPAIPKPPSRAATPVNACFDPIESVFDITSRPSSSVGNHGVLATSQASQILMGIQTDDLDHTSSHNGIPRPVATPVMSQSMDLFDMPVFQQVSDKASAKKGLQNRISKQKRMAETLEDVTSQLHTPSANVLSLPWLGGNNVLSQFQPATQ
ncbi:hypothetical protein KIPB_011901, partial [Kipferlia bialata]|eukprot:g11901.t1